MEIEISEKKKVDVTTLKVRAGVRYWEDATVDGEDDTEGNLIPCRIADSWCPLIDLTTGKITNWNIATAADIHYKICDDGEYWLLDKDGNEVKYIDGYVPDIMCPKGNGYGDYIIMEVDESGTIQNFRPVLNEFLENED